MKKLIFVFLILILGGCTSQKVYTDFDYSFARSGGRIPMYENLLITGNNVHYSFEGQGKDIKKNFTISTKDLRHIENTLAENNFTRIQEDYKKIYDNVAVEINIKKGKNAGNKSDASLIMPKDQARWDEIVSAFQKVIDRNIKTES